MHCFALSMNVGCLSIFIVCWSSYLLNRSNPNYLDWTPVYCACTILSWVRRLRPPELRHKTALQGQINCPAVNWNKVYREGGGLAVADAWETLQLKTTIDIKCCHSMGLSPRHKYTFLSKIIHFLWSSGKGKGEGSTQEGHLKVIYRL